MSFDSGHITLLDDTTSLLSSGCVVVGHEQGELHAYLSREEMVMTQPAGQSDVAVSEAEEQGENQSN